MRRIVTKFLVVYILWSNLFTSWSQVALALDVSQTFESGEIEKFSSIDYDTIESFSSEEEHSNNEIKNSDAILNSDTEEFDHDLDDQLDTAYSKYNDKEISNQPIHILPSQYIPQVDNTWPNRHYNLVHAVNSLTFYDFLMNQDIKLGYEKGSMTSVFYNGFNSTVNRFNTLGAAGYTHWNGRSNAFYTGTSNVWDFFEWRAAGREGLNTPIVAGLDRTPLQRFITKDNTIEVIVRPEFSGIRIVYTRLRNAPSNDAMFSTPLNLEMEWGLDVWNQHIHSGGILAPGFVFGSLSSTETLWNNVFDMNLAGLIEEPPQVSLTAATVQHNRWEELKEPADYVTTSNFMNGGELTYTWVVKPNINEVSRQVGRIKVTDKLGEYVNIAEIDVVFYVNQLELSAEAVPLEKVLGEVWSAESIRGLVRNVRVGNKELSSTEYTVREIRIPRTDTIGEATAEVEVVENEYGYSLLKKIPIQIVFGHALFSREASSNASTGVVNLIPTERGPRLAATIGFGTVQNPNGITSRPRFTLYKENYANKTFLPLDTVNQSRETLVFWWGYRLGLTPINYGDVLGLSVNRFAVAAQNYNGANTWVTRNEVPTLETQGFSEALYMITKDGYELLRINQLTNKHRTIPLTSSVKEKLENSMSDFFEFPSEFTDEEKQELSYELLEYDDLSQKGKKNAVIRITQTKAAGTFSMDYDVSFDIVAGPLEISSINNGYFEFGNVLQSSRSQTIFANGDSAPVLTISDYSDSTNWTLYVSSTPFVDNTQHKLKGASLTLSNIKVVESVHTLVATPSRNIVLDQTPQLIGTMQNPSGMYGEENGETTIQIGETRDGMLTGISLYLPANTPMNSNLYSTEVTWEMVGDPTLGGAQ